jgi:DNA-binding MarR family transcriptional regulator
MSAVSSADSTVLLTGEELGAWRGLLRVHAGMTKALDAELVREHGLPLSSYEVLLFLADSPEGRLRMSDLADGVLLSRSGLTRLVDRMERDGLLRRERCEDDARGYNAAITPKGRELFQRARRTHLAGVRERFLSHLSADELRTLAELWEKVAPGAAS